MFVLARLGHGNSLAYGIIGAAQYNGGLLITDASWKCSREYEDGWSDCGFDDSNWSNAVEIQQNNDIPSFTASLSLLPEQEQELWSQYPLYEVANWIWADSGARSTVYCRKGLQRGRLI